MVAWTRDTFSRARVEAPYPETVLNSRKRVSTLDSFTRHSTFAPAVTELATSTPALEPVTLTPYISPNPKPPPPGLARQGSGGRGQARLLQPGRPAGPELPGRAGPVRQEGQGTPGCRGGSREPLRRDGALGTGWGDPALRHARVQQGRGGGAQAGEGVDGLGMEGGNRLLWLPWPTPDDAGAHGPRLQELELSSLSGMTLVANPYPLISLSPPGRPNRLRPGGGRVGRAVRVLGHQAGPTCGDHHGLELPGVLRQLHPGPPEPGQARAGQPQPEDTTRHHDQ